jgi:hypothetical protein
VFANKIKRFQACIDAHGNHFQHLLQVHSEFPNADLQKVFANKIKRVQTCIEARGNHFQHLLQVHSEFPNADLLKVFANKIKRFQACIDAHGHHFQDLCKFTATFQTQICRKCLRIKLNGVCIDVRKHYFQHLLYVHREFRYGLDGPRIESRWGRDFPHLSKTALWPTQPSTQRVLGISWR